MNQITDQYQADYFGWQHKVGEFGGKANLFKFQQHIKTSDRVLDYGCGGGYLLAHLDCHVKVGLDINPSIKAPDGVVILKSFNEIVKMYGLNSFDVVISNHALEHMDSPANALKDCFELLKPGGRIVVVVPSETHKVKYIPGDINKHIITFAPMNIGNLLTLSGFRVININRLFHKWPPRYELISKINWKLFHFTAYLYGAVKRNSIQLIAIAEKPK